MPSEWAIARAKENGLQPEAAKVIDAAYFEGVSNVLFRIRLGDSPEKVKGDFLRLKEEANAE